MLDLLIIEEHKPTATPIQFDKKSGDWYTHDAINGVDGPPPTPRSRVKDSDTKFVKMAKEGGHKGKPTCTCLSRLSAIWDQNSWQTNASWDNLELYLQNSHCEQT